MKKVSSSVINSTLYFLLFSIAIVCAYRGQFQHPHRNSSIYQYFQSAGFNLIKFKQDWGSLRVGWTASDQPIVVGGKRYVAAIGAHANSKIWLETKNTQPDVELSGSCAYPDRFVNRVRCSIRQGTKSLFHAELSPANRKIPFSVSIDKSKPIVLGMSPLSNNINNAHGAWLELKLTQRK